MARRSMRICIIALGTRGDVHPCVAPARGLRAAGHTVRVVSEAIFESVFQRHEIEFSAVQVDSRAFLQTDVARNFLEGEKKAFFTPSLWRSLGRKRIPAIHQRFVESWRACQDAEAIVVTPLGVLLAYSIAEKLDRPPRSGLHEARSSND